MPVLEPAHALIIGIGTYQHPVGTLPKLTASRIEAEALSEHLIAHGGYPRENVTLLVDKDATRPRIFGTLEALTTSDPEATLFIYFTGHGWRIPRGHGELSDEYFAPFDVDLRNPKDLTALASSAISGAALSEFLARIPARRLMLTFNCCNSGGLGDASDPRLVEIRSAMFTDLSRRLPPGRGRVVFSAARADEPAWASDKSTAFGRHFLDALRGGAQSAGGLIRVFDLVDHVTQQVLLEKREQIPVCRMELEINFAIARAPARPGGAVPSPTPDASYAYDVYIVCADADRKWVRGVLAPRLVEWGLRVITRDGFRLGVPTIKEMARAVEESRHTLAVLSRAANADGFADLARVMAMHRGTEQNEYQLLAIVRELCPLDLELRIAPPLDMSDAGEFEANIERLIFALCGPRSIRKAVNP